MLLSTKTGDTGTTSVFGHRIEKSSSLIDALGECDTCIAECILLSSKWDFLTSTSKQIVEDLNSICAILAGYADITAFSNEKTMWLENEMDKNKLEEEFHFVYPFDNELCASINHLRTTTRRLERYLWKCNIEYPIDQNICNYINRLSDFWFVIGCKQYFEFTKKETVQ